MAKPKPPQKKITHPEQPKENTDGGVVAPEWFKLPDHLEVLLHIVPDSNSMLERTTILTWLYRRKGVMPFQEFMGQYEVDQFPATKRRAVRRSLIGLARIGAIKLVNMGEHGTIDLVASELERESDRNTSLGAETYAILSRGGMTWLSRAWAARFKAMGNRPGMLNWAHQCFLEEEEEGKGTDGHWIESLGAGEYPRDAKPAGELTAWIGTAVSSVFDIPTILAPKKKAASKRLERA